jgi:hypothetical protein
MERKESENLLLGKIVMFLLTLCICAEIKATCYYVSLGFYKIIHTYDEEDTRRTPIINSLLYNGFIPVAFLK